MRKFFTILATSTAFLSLAASPSVSSEKQDRLISPVSDMAHEEIHALNDAWLGMPVLNQNGTKIGVVIDAPLDEEGYVARVIVDPFPNSNLSDDDILVFDGDQATLTTTAVQIESVALMELSSL